MTDQLSTTITVGGVTLAVEMHDSRRTRRVTARIVDNLPIPLSDWPVPPAEIERLSNEMFDRFGCRPQRDDAVWAVGKADIVTWDADRDRSYFWRAVPTSAERREIERAARDEAEDGLV